MNVFLAIMPGLGLRLPVTANLAAWFNADKGITIATGVSAWADQSGNSRTLSQGTAGNQPSYSATGGPNSIGALTLDGVDDRMATAGFTLNQPVTHYFLTKQISWLAGHRIFDGNTANSNLLMQTDGGGGSSAVSPNILAFAGTRSSSITTLSIGSWGVVTVVFNGASSEIRLNFAASLTGDFGATNAGGLNLGSVSGSGDAPANVSVAEWLVYSAAHNTATQDQIIRYLMRRAGL